MESILLYIFNLNIFLKESNKYYLPQRMWNMVVSLYFDYKIKTKNLYEVKKGKKKSKK